MKYSIIVPVFNRPNEVDELLTSLTIQTFTNFEVVIVEDGSKTTCKDVCDKYSNSLDLKYFIKENSGPGQSRNYGAKRANGDYLIILDSDVVLPKNTCKPLMMKLTIITLMLSEVPTVLTNHLPTLKRLYHTP